MSYTILNLPIEPIDGRYSSQWDLWFEEAFLRNGIPFTTVRGEVPPPPPSDKFLNPVGTFSWKFAQLAKALRLTRDRSARRVVFLHDGWLPGIEMFPYARDLDGLDVCVAAFWHAGSYDPTDLLGLAGCDSWAWGSEDTWLRLCDRVFVGSAYHKGKILKSHPAVSESSIEVVGCPVGVPDGLAESVPKEPVVVWPHRLSPDKNPQVFERLRSEPRFAGAEFVRTRDRNLDKRAYYELLARARVVVSTASHENFGIAMVEAAMLGCLPVCPRGLSYFETMGEECLYDSYDDLVGKVEKGLTSRDLYVYPHVNRFAQAAVTDRICKRLHELGDL